MPDNLLLYNLNKTNNVGQHKTGDAAKFEIETLFASSYFQKSWR